MLRNRFAADPSELGWHRYIALGVGEGECTLIGTLGGFRHSAKPHECEIGYSVLPEFQGHGYATEAALALIAWIRDQPRITAITAQTYPSLPKSIRVMEKCGLTFVGPGDEEGTIRYRREG